MNYIPKHCLHCLGECLENCQPCIYSCCKKPVDEKLVTYQYNRMLVNIDDDHLWKQFHDWFRKYFMLD